MSKRKAEQDYVFDDSDVKEIKNSQGFVLSPNKDKRLNMVGGKFLHGTVGVFLRDFAAMPDLVTFLRLDMNGLGTKNVKKLVEIFAAIPINVTSLSLGSNNLDCLLPGDLATVLRALPPSVTSLDLEGNELYIFTGEELAIVFAALSPTVTSLSLRANRLGEKTQEKYQQLSNSSAPSKDLIEARSLPIPNIGQKLALAFAAFPSTVTSLDLSFNDFDKANAEDLAQAFAALPPTVTALYFSSADFHDKTEEQLVFIFGALHNSLTALALRKGNIETTVESIGCILSTMASKSSNLNFLDLKDNDLGEKAVGELCKLFKAIPKSVTEIDLSGNSFGRKTAEELAEIFGSMPDSVTSLNLSEDYLAAFFALENEAVLCPVFRHISTLCLGDTFMASLPPEVRLRLPNVFPRLAKLISVDQWGNKIEVGPYCDPDFIWSFGVIPSAPSVQSSLSMFAPTNTIPMEEVPEPENTGISCLVS